MSQNQATDIFKKRLREAREMRGFTQAELAAKSGLPAASVSHFESGPRKPSFDNLKNLAEALKVTTDYLLGRSDTPDASAPVGRIHRDLHKLTSKDLELTEQFVELLLKQRGTAKGDE
jgi:transcriptional regulator with XRE-family HTH domain